MKLDWMMLANYAEERGGLLYIMGGTWDTTTVNAPLEGGPDDVLGVIQGSLVIRLLFHPTETGRERSFKVTVHDADGKDLGGAEGRFQVGLTKGLPAGWDQGVNLVIPMTGFPLPREGNYVINLLVDDQFVGDRPFRIIKGFT